MKRQFKILTVNIGNPSVNRVQKQIDWLSTRNEDVFVLTETKNSKGCSILEEYYSGTYLTFFNYTKRHDYNVYFPKSKTGDLGVMILSKFPIIKSSTCFNEYDQYYSRLVDVVVDFYGEKIGIMGLYVPSRNSSERKIKRKKDFIIQYLLYLKQVSINNSIPYIICGDLNVLERGHRPHYKIFQRWEYDFYDRFEYFGYVDAFRYMYPEKDEYSWVGRTNDGYRYDHFFVSKEITERIIDCFYVHETRNISITDHSAMSLVLEV